MARRVLVMLALLMALAGPVARAAEPATTDARMTELMRLLDDPDVRARLMDAAPAHTPTSPRQTMSTSMAASLGGLHTRLLILTGAIPAIPDALSTVWRSLAAGMPDRSGLWVLGYIVTFIAGGMAVERLVFRALLGWRHHLGELHLDTARQRARAAVERLLFGLVVITGSVAGSVGTFLLFDWPPMTGSVILGYLIASVIYRLGFVTGRFLFAPGAPRLRLVPMTTERAWFWHRRLAALVGVVAFGRQTIVALRELGMPDPARSALAALIGLAMLAVAIGIVWQARPSVPGRRLHLSPLALFWTVWLPAIWLAFVGDAPAIAWTMLVVALVPPVVGIIRRVVDTIVYGSHTGEIAADRAWGVVAERGGQAVILILAAAAVAHVWELDLSALAATDTAGTRFARGVLEAVVIVLLADLGWQLLRVVIDTRLAGVAAGSAAAAASEDEQRRQARLRTLLPIVRNLSMVVVIVLAAMSALSALGLQIGPLLAGAGVVGISVGFGAQTLVRDLLAGLFFLLDDAFRVGEFIESGGISGTVESFSLRSIKLRHVNGQLQTVPFGDLKSIVNFSRDWVSQELRVSVTHDTDLDELEALIEEVSAGLMEDPASAALILDPVRSEGVLRIGENGIEIGLLVRTPPGKQFRVRALVYDRIKKAFARHGIRFAVPTLNVAPGVPSPIGSSVPAGASPVAVGSGS
jgi:small-conductance mechanosensitive channel